MWMQKTKTAFAPDKPLIEWLRERESRTSQKVFIRAAVALLLLIPIAFLPPQEAWANPDRGTTAGVMLLFPTLAVAVLFTIAFQWRLFGKYPPLEAILWLAFFAFIGSAVWSNGLVSAGIQINHADGDVQALGDNQRTLIAWTLVAYLSLAVFVSAWGLVGHPWMYAALVAAHFILSLWDEPLFDKNGKLIVCLGLMNLFAVAFHQMRYTAARRVFIENQKMTTSREKDARFIAQILPEEVLKKIERNERVADSFSNLTVVFADMAGFTELSRRTSPGHLVDLLNEVFHTADECAQEHGIERVKTIGDCYMAVAGGIRSKEATTLDAVAFTRRYIEKVSALSKKHDLPISLRVGVHTGPAIGGVIGSRQPAYGHLEQSRFSAGFGRLIGSSS